MTFKKGLRRSLFLRFQVNYNAVTAKILSSQEEKESGDFAVYTFQILNEPSMAYFTPKEVTTTDKVIGKGAYGKVLAVYVHGTLCAAKVVHPILVEYASPEELKSTK